jgi:membrane protein YdbS with pleckstrin-like domain
MNDLETLISLDPAYARAIRLGAVVPALAILAIALVAEVLAPWQAGLILAPGALFALWLLIGLPPRRYKRWGYALDADCLRIVSGYLFRTDTVVPLGRVQHIDVDQGPIMRRYGLATLTLHTAGNANASVSLPGLAHADALAMREAIRTRIKAGQA